MSSFEPNKRHLREVLIYFFNLKKSAAEAHRLLAEKYGKAALSERSCREWLQNFKNGEFDIQDKERNERTKVYEDAKLELLLDLCLIFDKKRAKLICTPEIMYFLILTLLYLCTFYILCTFFILRSLA